jgi:hypothetical protein
MGQFPCTRQSRSPDLRNPEMSLAMNTGLGVSAPGKPKCETSCLRISRNPDLRNPEIIIARISLDVSVFRHPGYLEASPWYTPVPNSRLVKSRYGLAHVDLVFGVSAPGKPKGMNPSSSSTAKTRYAKLRKVECQVLIRGIVRCDKLLVPFGFRHFERPESRGTHASRFPESRKPEAPLR